MPASRGGAVTAAAGKLRVGSHGQAGLNIRTERRVIKETHSKAISTRTQYTRPGGSPALPPVLSCTRSQFEMLYSTSQKRKKLPALRVRPEICESRQRENKVNGVPMPLRQKCRRRPHGHAPCPAPGTHPVQEQREDGDLDEALGQLRQQQRPHVGGGGEEVIVPLLVEHALVGKHQADLGVEGAAGRTCTVNVLPGVHFQLRSLAYTASPLAGVGCHEAGQPAQACPLPRSQPPNTPTQTQTQTRTHLRRAHDDHELHRQRAEGHDLAALLGRGADGGPQAGHDEGQDEGLGSKGAERQAGRRGEGDSTRLLR